MVCSQCGSAASGRFCSQCGEKLVLTAEPILVAEVVRPGSPPPLPFRWEHDCCYEKLIAHPAVRPVLAQHAAQAKTGITGEQFLSACDKLISSPVSFAGVAALVQPLYASWGMRTGKQRCEQISAPAGRALARVLCSLARHGQTIQRVEQGPHGCHLTATLPSSLCSFAGELKLLVEAHGTLSQLTAETIVPGQLYDWGKSRRVLDQLFQDIQHDQGLPPADAAHRAA